MSAVVVLSSENNSFLWHFSVSEHQCQLAAVIISDDFRFFALSFYLIDFPQ